MKVTPENHKRVIPKGYRLIVRHYHMGNDAAGTHRSFNGRVKPFATRAWIKVDDKQDDTVFAIGEAFCSRNDVPCRRRGWEIAAGRAYKAFSEAKLANESD